MLAARFSVLFWFVAAVAAAGEADVLKVEVWRSEAREYRFAVTVRHGDTGWDHYADRWEVVAGWRRARDPRAGSSPRA